MRGLDAFGGHASGHLQLFKAQGAVAAAINMNFIVVGRLEAKSTKSEMFERFQDFGSAFEKNLFVFAVEVGEDLGIACSRSISRWNRAHIHFQFEAGDAHHAFEKLAQSIGRGLPVEFAVVNEFLSHRASGT